MKSSRLTCSFALSMLAVFLVSFQAAAEDVVASGTFVGASGHETRGGVSIVKSGDSFAVVLGSDFYLDGAPDPKVGFGKSGEYDIQSQLAHLQSKTGEQTYPVPATLDIGGYDEVYIWCEKFSVPLGVAKIM